MDLVTFEIAKKLKEKGFREKVNAYYDIKFRIYNIHPALDMNNVEYRASAPTISQVLKWLREEKKIHICISYSDNINTMWEYEVILLDGALYQNDDSDYISYEQAALAGIEYVLDNLI